MFSRNISLLRKLMSEPQGAPGTSGRHLGGSSAESACEETFFSHPEFPSRRSWLLRAYGSLLGVLGLTGCGRIHGGAHGAGNPWELKTPKMSPDAVVLEVAILHIPAAATGASPPAGSPTSEAPSAAADKAATDLRWADVWHDVDEQFLPTALRRKLAENGFRCGFLDGRPSPALQTALDSHAERHSHAAEDEDRSVPTGIQRLQNRSGRRGKILTSEIQESLAVLLPEAGRVRGQTYSQAQCLFSVRSFPQGDGSTQLELTPEIEFGEARPRWLGESGEGSFRVDTSRERREFESLRIATQLSPGQMLVLGPLPQLKGLGRQFFAETARGGDQPRVLIIRLAQTQLDDLFAPEQDRPPLVSLPD